MSSDTEPPEGLGTGHPGTQRVPCPNYSGVRTHHLPLKNGLAPHASHAGKAERHPPGPPRPTKEHTPSSARHPKTRMRTCGGQVAAPPTPRGARPRQAGPAAAAEPREWRWGLAAEPASAAANRRGPRGQRRRVHVSGPPGPAALCAGVCVLKPPPASSFWDWHRRATHCPLCGVTRLQTTVPAPSRAGVSRASCVQGRGGGSSASPEARSCPVGEPRATGRSRTETAANATRAEGGAGAPRAYLQHAAHPLEAVLLGGVRPLLRHQHHPVVMQHRHREHGDPEHEGERDRAAKGALSPARPARQGLPAEDVQSHRPPVPSAAAETH